MQSLQLVEHIVLSRASGIWTSIDNATCLHEVEIIELGLCRCLVVLH